MKMVIFVTQAQAGMTGEKRPFCPRLRYRLSFCDDGEMEAVGFRIVPFDIDSYSKCFLIRDSQLDIRFIHWKCLYPWNSFKCWTKGNVYSCGHCVRRKFCTKSTVKAIQSLRRCSTSDLLLNDGVFWTDGINLRYTFCR